LREISRTAKRLNAFHYTKYLLDTVLALAL